MGLDRNNLTANMVRLMSPGERMRYASDPRVMVRPSASSYRAETKQQAAFAAWLVKRLLLPPAIWHNTAKRSTGTAGCPDFVVPVKGVTLYIEFKQSSGEVSPVQRVYQRRLEEQGYQYLIVESAEQALALVEAIL